MTNYIDSLRSIYLLVAIPPPLNALLCHLRVSFAPRKYLAARRYSGGFLATLLGEVQNGCSFYG